MTNKRKVFTLSFLTVFFWASAFPITKIAQEQFSSNTLGFLRCSLAAFFLLIIGKCMHIKKPKQKDIPWFFLSGGLGFTIYLLAFNTGIQTITSATSSVVMSITPILTAILGTKLYNETIRPFGWLSIFTAFIGVLILLLWDGIFSINIGLLWTLLASIVFCGYNILSRKLSQKKYSPLEIVTYSMLCGAILLFFFSFGSIGELKGADTKHIFSLFYLGALPSATSYLLWGKAMSLADRTSEVTNFMFVTPLLSTIMGFMLLREVPSAGTFIGGIIIITGVVSFNLKGK